MGAWKKWLSESFENLSVPDLDRSGESVKSIRKIIFS